MSAYVYASGSYHPLEGNKVVSGGQLVTLKNSDKIVLDGSRYTLGEPTFLRSGVVITTTETYQGATVEDFTVANGGILTVSGGVVKNLSVGSGGSAVLIDAESPSPYSIQIASSGSVVASNSLVHSLSCVPNCEYRQIGGNLANWNRVGNVHVQDCVIQKNGVEYGGFLFVSSGGTANSTTVNSGGSMTVTSGGTANSVTLNSSGSMAVTSGGTAINTTVNYFGFMTVYSGGTANHTIVSGGYSNGTVRGYLYVSSGGTASSVTLHSGILYVYSGGYALNVVKNGGIVSAYEGSIVTYANN